MPIFLFFLIFSHFEFILSNARPIPLWNAVKNGVFTEIFSRTVSGSGSFPAKARLQVMGDGQTQAYQAILTLIDGTQCQAFRGTHYDWTLTDRLSAPAETVMTGCLVQTPVAAGLASPQVVVGYQSSGTAGFDGVNVYLFNDDGQFNPTARQSIPQNGIVALTEYSPSTNQWEILIGSRGATSYSYDWDAVTALYQSTSSVNAEGTLAISAILYTEPTQNAVWFFGCDGSTGFCPVMQWSVTTSKYVLADTLPAPVYDYTPCQIGGTQCVWAARSDTGVAELYCRNSAQQAFQKVDELDGPGTQQVQCLISDDLTTTQTSGSFRLIQARNTQSSLLWECENNSIPLNCSVIRSDFPAALTVDVQAENLNAGTNWQLAFVSESGTSGVYTVSVYSEFEGPIPTPLPPRNNPGNTINGGVVAASILIPLVWISSCLFHLWFGRRFTGCDESNVFYRCFKCIVPDREDKINLLDEEDESMLSNCKETILSNCKDWFTFRLFLALLYCIAGPFAFCYTAHWCLHRDDDDADQVDEKDASRRNRGKSSRASLLKTSTTHYNTNTAASDSGGASHPSSSSSTPASSSSANTSKTASTQCPYRYQTLNMHNTNAMVTCNADCLPRKAYCKDHQYPCTTSNCEGRVERQGGFCGNCQDKRKSQRTAALDDDEKCIHGEICWIMLKLPTCKSCKKLVYGNERCGLHPVFSLCNACKTSDRTNSACKKHELQEFLGCPKCKIRFDSEQTVCQMHAPIGYTRNEYIRSEEPGCENLATHNNQAGNKVLCRAHAKACQEAACNHRVPDAWLDYKCWYCTKVECPNCAKSAMLPYLIGTCKEHVEKCIAPGCDWIAPRGHACAKHRCCYRDELSRKLCWKQVKDPDTLEDGGFYCLKHLHPCSFEGCKSRTTNPGGYCALHKSECSYFQLIQAISKDHRYSDLQLGKGQFKSMSQLPLPSSSAASSSMEFIPTPMQIEQCPNRAPTNGCCQDHHCKYKSKEFFAPPCNQPGLAMCEGYCLQHYAQCPQCRERMLSYLERDNAQCTNCEHRAQAEKRAQSTSNTTSTTVALTSISSTDNNNNNNNNDSRGGSGSGLKEWWNQSMQSLFSSQKSFSSLLSTPQKNDGSDDERGKDNDDDDDD